MKKKFRTLLALILCLGLCAALLAGCGGVKTKTETKQTPAPQPGTSDPAKPDDGKTPAAPGDVTLLYFSNYEKIANIIRDELTKAGYNVKMNAQTDQTSFKEQKKAGNYDISIDNWSSPTGIPDFNIRPIVYTGGSQNLNGYSNADVDAKLDLAATLPADKYWDVYTEVGDMVTDELTWITPLYAEFKARACGEAVDGNTLQMMSTWSNFSYKDASLNDTRVLKLGTTNYTYTTFDPIRADDASIGMVDMNMYIRLIDQTDSYDYVTDDTLSYSYAIAEDAMHYYFLLRDDCFFTRVKADTTLERTDVMVSGEDVIYSLDRARTKDAVPLHAAYSNFGNITEVAMVEDLEELKSTTSTSGKSVYDVLSAEAKTAVETLSTSRDTADNDAGSYQVIRITTETAFPQILAYLSNHTAGIVDSEWVEAINSKVDFAAYDASKDTLYGDFTGVQKGANYANDISASGRYVLRYVDDYGAVFEKNPGLRMDEDPTGSAKIKNINVVFVANADSALSALRSGDIDINWSIATNKFDIVRGDSSLDLRKFVGQRFVYLSYNISDASVCADQAVRASIANAVVLEDVQAGMGEVIVSHSPYMCLLSE